MIVYKLCGEEYEITESREVFKTYEGAIAAIKDWEDFLGMSTEDALAQGEIFVVEYTLT